MGKVVPGGIHDFMSAITTALPGWIRLLQKQSHFGQHYENVYLSAAVFKP